MIKNIRLSFLIECHKKYFLPIEDKSLFFSDYKQLVKLLKIKGLKSYEIIYFNKNNINKLLYDKEKAIFVNSNNSEKYLPKLFYILLLINDKHHYNNYVYNFKYIILINNIITKTQKSLEKFLLCIMLKKLINNYKCLEDFYDMNDENELNNIYEKNNTFINYFNIKNELNLHFDNNQSNIEEIYLQIIISLIKNEKLSDYEYASNIFDQLDLNTINLTNYIYDKLIHIFEENIIKKNKIKNINNLFDKKIINFYYILLKYIYKIPLYIYNIPFLLDTRKAILNIIKFDINKFSIFNISDINIKHRMEYILRFFCDSDYYYMKYYGPVNLGEKYEQLKAVLIYYRTYKFETKKEDIIILDKFIRGIKNEIKYDIYLKDYEQTIKMNERIPIINYLLKEDNEDNQIKSEKKINKIVKKWELLENLINNKKLKKMRNDDKILLKKYFNNIENKNILFNIFNKENYEYIVNYEDSIIKETNLPLNKSKNEESINK